jgi:hypothetical protein
VSTMTRTAGLSQLDPFYLDADAYAKSIKNVPLNWWPQCVEHGLGAAKRRMPASVEMVCTGNRYDVKMRVDLPLISLGSVDLCCPVNQELKAKCSVDKALTEMKDFFGVQLLERMKPSTRGCLIVWNERKNDER